MVRGGDGSDPLQNQNSDPWKNFGRGGFGGSGGGPSCGGSGGSGGGPPGGPPPGIPTAHCRPGEPNRNGRRALYDEKVHLNGTYDAKKPAAWLQDVKDYV